LREYYYSETGFASMKESTMKDILCKVIEDNKQEIIDLGTDIFENPELGFKEVKTAAKIASVIEDLNIDVEKELSVTGVKGVAGQSGINICLIAEMDAIPTMGHQFSSQDQEAAHSCAHSNQVAIMLGVMKAIKETGLLEKLGGKITFIGTPAEEFIDLEFRRTLQNEGKIDYLSGKQDLISKGVFDNVDMVISCHTMGGISERMCDVNSSLNGFISKKIIYHGKGSHAGAAPHRGVNALNAATIGLTAVNAQRETFIDDYNVRVHGIITEGGQAVNSVPDRVVLEAMVRGGTLEAIVDANLKVNRAFEAGAYAVGGKCEIVDTVGYVPFKQCESLSEVMKENLSSLIGKENIKDGEKSMASGDIGDLGTIVPTIQFGFSGFSGRVHGPDFTIEDNDMAYVIPAKAIAMTVYDLLKDEGKLAKKIIEQYPPLFTKEGYVEHWLKNGSLNV